MSWVLDLFLYLTGLVVTMLLLRHIRRGVWVLGDYVSIALWPVLSILMVITWIFDKKVD